MMQLGLNNMIKFELSKKKAISYLKSMDQSIWDKRFRPEIKRSSLKDILKYQTLYICAKDDNNNVIGVLDGHLASASKDKLLIEISLATHIPGTGVKLIQEYKRLYPNTKTFALVQPDNIEAIKFALQYIDYVGFSELYRFLVDTDNLLHPTASNMCIKGHPDNINYKELKTKDTNYFIILQITQLSRMMLDIGFPIDYIEKTIRVFDSIYK